MAGSHSGPNVHPRHLALNFVWNTSTLAWDAETQPGGGGGGGDASAANQTTEIARLTSILGQLDVALSTRTKPSDQQHAIIDSSALPSGAATETTLGTRLTESDFDTKTGSLTEAAPATDTASSGLNGRLQRIAQRLTSLIALFPSALVGGRFDINNGAWLGSTAPTVGSKTSANSVPVGSERVPCWHDMDVRC